MLRRGRARWPTRLGDPAVRSDVLNNVAFGALHRARRLDAPMREALRLALEAGAEAQAGRAYANIYTFYAAQYRFAEGERFWRDGIAYCDERDITTYATCLRGHRAIALLDLGRWDEAAAIAERVLATEASPVNLLTSQITLGADPGPARRLPGALDVLDAGGRRGRQPRRGGVDRGDPTGPRRGALARRRRRGPLWPTWRAVRAVSRPWSTSRTPS